MVRRIVDVPNEGVEAAARLRRNLGEIVEALDAAHSSVDTGVGLALPSGERLAIPESLVRVLRDAAQAMARGSGRVRVVPEEQELTTRQAADLLGVSRPYLIQLLDQADIPYRMVRTHRRIPLEALLAYRVNQEARADSAFQEMIDLTEEADLYNAGKRGQSARG